MASSFRATLDTILSHLMASGWFDSVNSVEPSRPPGTGFEAAVWLSRVELPGATSGIDRASAVYTYLVRLYRTIQAQPPENIDPDLLQIVEKVFDDFAGDYTLGGTIRAVDFFGAHSDGLNVEAAYVEVGGQMFRAYDINLPLIINDAVAAFSP